MKRAIPCTKCKAPTEIKRVRVKLLVDVETNQTVNVSSRVQACPTCKYEEYTEKEKNRLLDLTAFYAKESLLEEEEDKQVDTETIDKETDELEIA